MNKDQMMYNVGRIINPNADLVFLMGSGVNATLAMNSLSQNGLIAGISGTVFSALSAFFAYQSIKPIKSRMRLYKSKKGIGNYSKYPLENVKKIIISDTYGLNKLLKRTEKSDDREWGSILRTMHTQDTVYIYQIIESETAKKLGVDMKKLSTDLKDESIMKRIAADMDEAKKFNMSGTPGFIINGVSLRGAYPFPEFKQIIDQHLSTLK